ncbi:MAG TPA: homoserine kinase, partial [Thermoanaerobaculia bacterium]|nr:homoserine kinase [Thermoanaerobaculia bacterium]
MSTAFAPGSVGNVGPGFDVLGLAVEGIGDLVTVELTSGPSRIESITGRDADLLPRDPSRNAAAIAAIAWLRANRREDNVIVSIDKGLALSGGMGGSAASAVAGAYAAALSALSALPSPLSHLPSPLSIITAALEAESLVAGRHLDNIA